MAKSIRSKWKRKMRASKRERYGKKELERLKTMLGLNTTDVEMKDEPSDDKVVVIEEGDESKQDTVDLSDEAPQTENKDELEPMDDGRRIFNTRTLKDQHGKYPVWLSSRKLKKAVKRNQVVKQIHKKKQKKVAKKQK